MRNEQINAIVKLLNECEDVELLDFILQLLAKSC